MSIRFIPCTGNLLFMAIAVITGHLAAGTSFVDACPFCSATSQTLSEELAGTDVAVLAKLVKAAPTPTPNADDPAGLNASGPDTGLATFTVQEILRGKEQAEGLDQIEVVYFGSGEEDKSFLINGIAGERIDWTTPLPLSPEAVIYVKQLGSLPEKGADRLAFFLGHLENKDPLLAQDAYDEFARAPYKEVIDLKDRMDRQQLVHWINDSQIGPTRRRLYLTMLGVCGQAEDIEMLEELLQYDYQKLKPGIAAMMSVMGSNGLAAGAPIVDELARADVRRKKQCLDALVGAYLKLKGPEGLALVDRLFLSNPDAEYTHVYATIMALRFHGEETNEVPRDRLLQSMRLVLDNPEIADQVIPDLARWEDWSILDRLITMFKASEKDAWIRQPVISYILTAADQPAEVGQRANQALGELEKIDPEGIKRARSYMAFGLLARNASKKNDSPKTGENASVTEDSSEKTVEKAGASEPATDNVAGPPSGTSTSDADSTDTTVKNASDTENNPGETSEKSATPESATGNVAVAPTDTLTSTAESADSTDKTTASAPATDLAPRTAGPSQLMIVGVPLVAGLLLMGIFALLLRGGDLRTHEEKGRNGE